MRKNTFKRRTSENLLTQLDKLTRHNRQGSYKTKERYYEAMKRFCDFVWVQFKLQKLANISEKHVIAYVADMQERELSASTIKTNLAAIRFWHDQIPNAKHELPSNNELNLKRRSFGKVDRAWTHAEYNRMVALCWKLKREDYAAIFTLARYAGLRIHECFRIDTATAEAAFRSKEITIKGKGGKVRTIPINQSIKIEFGTLMPDLIDLEFTALLIATERGHKLFVPDDIKTHVAIKQFQHFIIKYRELIQDPDSERSLTFHGLRHLCAAEWYLALKDKGYDELSARKQVSLWLGHEREDVTRIYLASLPRMEAGRE